MPNLRCLVAPEERRKWALSTFIDSMCIVLGSPPLHLVCPKDKEHIPKRVRAGGGPLLPPSNVGNGCDSMLRWPWLFGLQTQDPTVLPWDVSIWICVISPLLAGLKWICFSSPLLSLTQNKIWPYLSCLSICSQLSITQAWII